MPSGVYQHKSTQGFQKGEKHWKWRKIKPIYRCIDCGKEISDHKAKRCKKCCGILRKGKKQPNISKAKMGRPNYKIRKYGMGKMKNYSKMEKIRKSIEYQLWRKAIFQRDNFTCQKYGIRGGRLVAHHINNFADFSELRLAIDNGITLSDKAHKEFHKKYGIKNNTKEQVEEFLKYAGTI